MIEALHYLALSLVLFCLGLAGVMLRRSLVSLLMSVQLLFSAAVLNFAAFSYRLSNLQGQATAVVVVLLAAAYVVLGVGLVAAVAHHRGSAAADPAEPAED